MSCKFVSKIKVNVDKYLNINAIIQLVRLLVSGSPGNGSLQMPFVSLSEEQMDVISLYVFKIKQQCVCLCV